MLEMRENDKFPKAKKKTITNPRGIDPFVGSDIMQ